MKQLLIIAAILSVGGCATVVRGTKDKVKFESEPTAAKVVVESVDKDKLGPFDCTAPCSLKLKRNRDWNVVFSLSGYKDAKGYLKSKPSGGGVVSGLGNALAGGIVGMGVDAGTGAMHDLYPNPMKAKLAPLESSEDSSVIGSDQPAASVPAVAPAPAETSSPSQEPGASSAAGAPQGGQVQPVSATVPGAEQPTKALHGDLRMDPIGNDAGLPGLTDKR